MEDVYRSVAELHSRNIDQGFLSSLGIRFLSLVYRAIDECEGSVLLLVRDEGRIVGFVAGGTGMGSIYKRMLRRAPSVLVSLLPSFFMPRRLWRIIETLRHTATGSKASDWLPSAELLSIAVDPAYRGRRHAETLYRDLLAWFTARGVLEFKIVVGEALAPAHSFYRRMGAAPVAETEVHRGARSIVYVHRLHREQRF